MSAWGQSRQSDRGPIASGLPRKTDILGVRRHVSKVPNSGLMHCSNEALFDHLSARASSAGGMVMPSALAVWRLMTSSNYVGCSTGRSAGLTPLSILSTHAATRRNWTEILAPYDISTPTSVMSATHVIVGRPRLNASSAMCLRSLSSIPSGMRTSPVRCGIAEIAA
jgi:hypothetical protein